MKVVLRTDVEHLGERGQVVNVARGYARNYLLPKGLALEATAGNLKTLELHRKVWEAREIREENEARAFAARLEKVRLRIAKKAGENDTLYGSVTTSEIADLLSGEGLEVDRRKIHMEEPVKNLGSFTVPVRVHKRVTAQVHLEVVPEEQ